MNQYILITAGSIISILILLIMAITTHNVIYSKLYAALAVIFGAYLSTKPLNKKIMTKIENLTLIEGNFSEDEAREIITNIFNSKINFHNIKNWSSQERFGKDDEIALNRVPALNKEIEKLQKILLEAKAKNKRLLISSQINISLFDE